MTNTFWQTIKAQLAELREAGSADDGTKIPD